MNMLKHVGSSSPHSHFHGHFRKDHKSCPWRQKSSLLMCKARLHEGPVALQNEPGPPIYLFGVDHMRSQVSFISSQVVLENGNRSCACIIKCLRISAEMRQSLDVLFTGQCLVPFTSQHDLLRRYQCWINKNLSPSYSTWHPFPNVSNAKPSDFKF